MLRLLTKSIGICKSNAGIEVFCDAISVYLAKSIIISNTNQCAMKRASKREFLCFKGLIFVDIHKLDNVSLSNISNKI